MLMMIGQLGHSAVLLPASLCLLALLALGGRRHDALAFAAALAICLATMLAAKLAVLGCEARLSDLDVESPSGHAAFATMFYPCVALILAAGRPWWERSAFVGSALLLAGLVGLSRVRAWVHTAPDVVIGTAVGLAAVFVFARLRGAPRPVVVPAGAILLGIPIGAIAVGAVLFAVRRWTPEPLIAAAASRLDLWLGLCL